MTLTLDPPTTDPPLLDEPVDDGTRREFLAGGTAALLTLSGCGGDAAPQAPRSRSVRHALGAARVPTRPQRVVALDGQTLDSLTGLGLTPVATNPWGTATGVPAYVSAVATRDVPVVGDGAEVDLERVAALRPDLLIGQVFAVEPQQARLEQIAPLVAYKPAEGTPAQPSRWQDELREVARLVGRDERGEEILDGYERRVAMLRTRLSDRLTRPSIAVMRVFSDGFRLYGPASQAGQVLRDLGVEVALIPTEETEAGFVDFSAERLGAVEADVLFVAVGNAGDLEDGAEELAGAQRNPLWERIPAVRAGRVCPISRGRLPAWFNLAPLAAGAVLDDIARCLAGP